MGSGDSRLQTNNGKQIPTELGPIFQRPILEIRRSRRIRRYTLLASGDDNNNVTDNEEASSSVNKLCLSVDKNNNNCSSSSSLSNIKTCPDSNARVEIYGDEKRVKRHEQERELIFAAGSPSFKVYLQEDHKDDDAVINRSRVPGEETASSVHVEQA